VHPVTVEIAELAGRIEGEQAARGVSIAFEDLLIGATALHLGYEVATLGRMARCLRKPITEAPASVFHDARTAT
jgi:predicted nucleic acid-binding protein